MTQVQILPSNLDIINALQYQAERTKLLYGQQLFNTMRYIYSHTICTVQMADTKNDYYYEPQFSDQAIKVTWKFNAMGCNMVSCNPVFPPSQTCNPNNNIASGMSFLSGDHTWVTACQPACYNTRLSDNKSTTNGSTQMDPQSPYTLWNGQKCYIESVQWLQFLTDPLKRVTSASDTPDKTGFDVEIYTNPDQDSILTGNITAQYCQDNYLDFDDANKKCDLTGFAYYVSYLIGDSLIKLARKATDKLEEAMSGLESQYQLHTKKAQYHFWENLTNWQNNINYHVIPLPIDIKLSDLGIYYGTSHMIWTNEFAHIQDSRNDKFNGRLVEPLLIYKSPSSSSKWMMKKNSKQQQTHSIPIINLQTSAKIQDWVRDLLNFILNVYGQLLTPEALLNLGIQLGTEQMLKLAAQQLKKVSAELISRLIANNLLKLVKSKMSVRFLGAIVSTTVIRAAVERVSLIVGKLALVAAKISTDAISVVGWILLIGPILDLIFTFWDPLKINSPTYSDDIIKQLGQGMLKTRQLMYDGERTVELEPEKWWKLFVVGNSQKFVQENTVMEMAFLGDYLGGRTFNSDGSAFNWDRDPIDTDTDIATIHRSLQQFNVNNMLFKTDDLEAYGKDSYKRASWLALLNQYFLIASLCCCGASILFKPTIGLLLLIIIIIIFGNIIIYFLYSPLSTIYYDNDIINKNILINREI
jgi:hypothetical protein